MDINASRNVSSRRGLITWIERVFNLQQDKGPKNQDSRNSRTTSTGFPMTRRTALTIPVAAGAAYIAIQCGLDAAVSAHTSTVNQAACCIPLSAEQVAEGAQYRIIEKFQRGLGGYPEREIYGYYYSINRDRVLRHWETKVKPRFVQAIGTEIETSVDMVTSGHPEYLRESRFFGQIENPSPEAIARLDRDFVGFRVQMQCDTMLDAEMDEAITHAARATRAMCKIFPKDANGDPPVNYEKALEQTRAKLLEKRKEIGRQIGQFKKWQKEEMTFERFPGDPKQFDNKFWNKVFDKNICELCDRLNEINERLTDLKQAEEFFNTPVEAVRETRLVA